MLQKCNIFYSYFCYIHFRTHISEISYSIFSMLVIKKTYYCEK